MESTSSFGYWIRRQRKALDLTQQALAERVGCSLAAIKKIEGDERRPSRQIAERLADVLGIPGNQREIYMEVARGFRPVDQLSLTREPVTPVPFESLKTVPQNLPVQLTSFVGREHELSDIKQLLLGSHLLTLTGPGGTGKTRLALQLAADVLRDFPNGIWLVELASLADPTLVTQTIASTLGVREQPRRPILDALMDYVRRKRMLLILDNCEHLIESCARIADSLLRVAEQLKILTTSREALGIAGEIAYRVPSLPLPDPRQSHKLDILSQNDSVHLFVDRAIAAHPPFRLKEKNALAITEICRRLDGIPLAIELAAARTKVFPPEEIATRLDDRFRLLTGGSRTALERHQTLFALIEWSHNLLTEAEQTLFQRLAVFSGGWSFEAAQAVCGETIQEDMLNLLTHLVDKSLVVVEEGTEEARYRLPETIRQYGRDKLLESGEVEKVRDRHLDFFLRLAETAEPNFRGKDQLEWLGRVETEHDNLRAALAWSLESGKSNLALQLVGALHYFWLLRGFFSEGQKWQDEALAFAERERNKKLATGNYISIQEEAGRRAKALYSAGYFRLVNLDLEKARPMVEESLHLWRTLGDKWGMAVALELKGLILQMEDNQAGLVCLEEGVSLAREIQDTWPLAMCLVRLGDSLKVKGIDMAVARQTLEEGVAMARKAGDKAVLSEGLRELGTIYYSEGNLTVAASMIEEALAEARAVGSIYSVFLALNELVAVSCLQNNPAKAKVYCFELWAICQETGALMGAAFSLLSFGMAASFGGEPEKGVHLLAATDAILRQHGVNFSSASGSSPFFKVYKQALEKAQAQLGPAAFQAGWAEGQQMTMEQALALATENEK